MKRFLLPVLLTCCLPLAACGSSSPATGRDGAPVTDDFTIHQQGRVITVKDVTGDYEPQERIWEKGVALGVERCTGAVEATIPLTDNGYLFGVTIVCAEAPQ